MSPRVASARPEWLRAALFVGVAYFLIGRVSTWPSQHVHAWRLAAWAGSGVAYAAHIAYEHFRLHSSPRGTALHTAVAVAIGALALAVAGMAHSWATTSSIPPTWLLALVIWPAVTAVPAYVAALGVGSVLARLTRKPPDSTPGA